jgi:hypothetical protein
VYDNYRPSPLGDATFQVAWVHIERLIDFGAHRRGARFNDRLRRGYKSEALRNYLVARANVQGRQSHSQSCCARCHSQCVLGPDEGCKSCFELSDFVAISPHRIETMAKQYAAPSKDVVNFRLLFSADYFKAGHGKVGGLGKMWLFDLASTFL